MAVLCSIRVVFSALFTLHTTFADAERTFARWESMRPSSDQQQQRQQRTAFLPQTDSFQGLRSALDSALGVGHGVQDWHMQEILAELTPTWKSLPQDSFGRVNRRSLNYVAHRYFEQRYSLSIIGLQPTSLNSSQQEAQLLADFAPKYVRSMQEGEASLEGFSIEEAVAMVVLLEHLLADSSRDLLEAVYMRYNIESRPKSGPKSGHSLEELRPMLRHYLLRWLLQEDAEALKQARRDPSYASNSFEDWATMAGLLPGSLEAFAHLSANGVRRAGASTSQSAWNPFHQSFSFEDTQLAASSLTSSFGSFWKTECSAVKEKLLRLDTASSGRVKLSKFHGAALSGDWHFSESKDYLRKLGALDETSSWHGPQVIIPNYLQSASNCIVTAPYYHICCPNECEAHLDALESAVGAPTADPKLLLALVRDLLAENSDDDARLPATMRSQLMAIASAHNGQVPLHGRLFAQWLHYAFPHECPFPHLSGTTEALTPAQFGEQSLATYKEMRMHKASENSTSMNRTTTSSLLDEEWMTMWSHEEELLSERLHLTAPWERNVFQILKLALGAALALCSMLGARKRFSESDVKKALPLGLSPEGKSHFV